jgi:hypothetical protein
VRRISTAFASAALAAAVLAGPAAGKWMLELGAKPVGLRAGDSWAQEVRVVGTHLPRRPGLPVVRIRNAETGLTLAYRAQPAAGQRRTFVATLRFPTEGRWRYAVRYAGGTYRFGAVDVAPRERQGSAPVRRSDTGDGSGGFPLWALVGGILGALLLGAIGLARFDVRRLRPWHVARSSARIASRGR